MLIQPYHLGTVARQQTMIENVWMSKAASVMVAGKQREKEDTELTNLGLTIPRSLIFFFSSCKT